MDINLPLILLIAVAVTGFVWLYDLLFLKKVRVQSVDALNNEYAQIPEEEKQADEKYQISLQRIAAEPVFVEYSKSFFPVLFIVFFLRSFLVEPFQIPSESMVPTLEVGDFILVNKYHYGVRLPVFRNKVIDINDPKRGDVMVFFPPHKSDYFIKRVIGLPGDKIEIVDGIVKVNGKVLEQKNAQVTDDVCRAEMYEGNFYVYDEQVADEKTSKMRKCVIPGLSRRSEYYVVPDGHYFMMGDNRDNSLDSRAWGPVPEERIVGKAFAIWMHWEKLMSIPSFGRVGEI